MVTCFRGDKIAEYAGEIPTQELIGAPQGLGVGGIQEQTDAEAVLAFKPDLVQIRVINMRITGIVEDILSGYAAVAQLALMQLGQSLRTGRHCGFHHLSM